MLNNPSMETVVHETEKWTTTAFKQSWRMEFSIMYQIFVLRCWTECKEPPNRFEWFDLVRLCQKMSSIDFDYWQSNRVVGSCSVHTAIMLYYFFFSISNLHSILVWWYVQCTPNNDQRVFLLQFISYCLTQSTMATVRR